MVKDKFNFRKINSWLKDHNPEQLAAYLKPEYIKKQIEKTTDSAKSNINTQPLVTIQVMTTEEYKGRVEKLTINYSFKYTRFGKLIIASTAKGVCYMGFADDDKDAVKELHRRFPHAHYVNREDEYQDNAFAIFEVPSNNENPIRLHLKGTPFQISIWKKLLNIPFGGLISYASLAGNIKKSRAAGTAVGDNPVGYLIPCHRVVRATGEFGGYYWGADRKAALIGWEAAMIKEPVYRKKRVLHQPSEG